ncbi:hypothetical protein N8D56_19015 [Devosia sp. A8/3-2]|nr:hypothetical protein N8D56_19015 [Devosia sp. A8/3-2]
MTVALTPAATVRSIRGRLATRRRDVTLGLAVALVLAFALALYLGDFSVAPLDVLRSLVSP